MNDTGSGIRSTDAVRLLSLAAIWGFSFIFIRVSAPALGPIVTVETRVAIAAILLFGYARFTNLQLELRERWVPYLVTGALSNAIPYGLIAVAELKLSASMAAILNATTPLFGAIVAALWVGEALTVKRLAGLAISFAGVVVLVGWSPLERTPAVAVAIGASLLASLSYGIGGAYVKKCAKGASSMGLAVGSQFGAGAMLAPAVPFALPAHVPPPNVIACAVALGVFCTGVALVLYYRLIIDIGPSRALTVTFLAPVFAVVWGRLFLSEEITLTKLVACGTILGGTALVTGFALPTQRFQRG